MLYINLTDKNKSKEKRLLSLKKKNERGAGEMLLPGVVGYRKEKSL